MAHVIRNRIVRSHTKPAIFGLVSPCHIFSLDFSLTSETNGPTMCFFFMQNFLMGHSYLGKNVMSGISRTEAYALTRFPFLLQCKHKAFIRRREERIPHDRSRHGFDILISWSVPYRRRWRKQRQQLCWMRVFNFSPITGPQSGIFTITLLLHSN